MSTEQVGGSGSGRCGSDLKCDPGYKWRDAKIAVTGGSAWGARRKQRVDGGAQPGNGQPGSRGDEGKPGFANDSGCKHAGASALVGR